MSGLNLTPLNIPQSEEPASWKYYRIANPAPTPNPEPADPIAPLPEPLAIQGTPPQPAAPPSMSTPHQEPEDFYLFQELSISPRHTPAPASLPRIFVDGTEQTPPNFDDMKHYLNGIYKREACAQTYELMDDDDNLGQKIAVIKSIEDSDPNYAKMHSHYTMRAEQGLGVLMGAYDLLKMATLQTTELTNTLIQLESLFKNLVKDLEQIETNISEAAKDKTLKNRLAIFNSQVISRLEQTPGFNQYINQTCKPHSWTSQRTVIKGALETARLWAPLQFQATTFVTVDKSGGTTVQEPIIVKSEKVQSTAKTGSLKEKLCQHHKKSFERGTVIPTQLTDTSSKLTGIGPRNARLTTYFNQAGKRISAVLSSGANALKSSSVAGYVQEVLKTAVSSLLGKFSQSFEVTNHLVLTNSVLRGEEGRASATAKEAGIRTATTGMFTKDPVIKVIEIGSPEDPQTPSVITSLFSIPSPSPAAAAPTSPASTDSSATMTSITVSTRDTHLPDKSNLQNFFELSSSCTQLHATASEVGGSVAVSVIDPDKRLKAIEAMNKALAEIERENDPEKKRLMHAILAWKVLDFNKTNPTMEPIPTIFDQFKSELGGKTIRYDQWQVALSAIIHDLSDGMLNIQCKSGKDRTGVIMVCHGILDRFYSDHTGFIDASGKQPTTATTATTATPASPSRKEQFESARETTISSGHVQLAASEGGTLGCIGVMASGSIKEALTTVLCLGKKDAKELRQALATDAAKDRKNLSCDDKGAARLDKINYLLALAEQTGKASSTNRKFSVDSFDAKFLGKSLGMPVFRTNSECCAQALKACFEARRNEKFDISNPAKQQAIAFFTQVVNASTLDQTARTQKITEFKNKLGDKTPDTRAPGAPGA